MVVQHASAVHNSIMEGLCIHTDNAAALDIFHLPSPDTLPPPNTCVHTAATATNTTPPIPRSPWNNMALASIPKATLCTRSALSMQFGELPVDHRPL